MGNMRTTYWGDRFVLDFGKNRDKLYMKRFGRCMPFPQHMGVPLHEGINIEDGRVLVTVVDNPDVPKYSIYEAIRKVENLFQKGYR